MKFLYSDTQDYVDPEYDFINDRNGPKRERYWTDAYAHELMTPAPYDGLLVSMSAVRQARGVAASKVRYSTKEEQRLLRDGIRKFLRFGGPRFQDCMVMGDCGAFAYIDQAEPAYTPEEVVEFYLEAGFSHGVSPDHVIFECDLQDPPLSNVSEQTRYRYDVTLSNARAFYALAKRSHFQFEPVGAVQGWSPASMAAAAKQLERMGYRYLAVGGLVPLKAPAIKAVLRAIREAIKESTDIHLLGFAKAEQIQDFLEFNITSFDSTSPLIRAFKDHTANYYLESESGGLEYYTAIRIPQSIENSRLMQGVKRGAFSAEDLQTREQIALTTLRAYDRGDASAPTTVEAVMDYYRFLLIGPGHDEMKMERILAKTSVATKRTIELAPWKRCRCEICRAAGVEVIVFRSSNRNKRRGFHNLGVYHKHLKKILENAQ